MELIGIRMQSLAFRHMVANGNFMNKTFLFGIGGIIFIGLFILAFQLTSPITPPSASTSVAPNVEQSAIPSGQNVTTFLPIQVATTSVVNTSSGPAQASSFINDPTTYKDPVNPGYYYLDYQANSDASTTVPNSRPYMIEYISATQFFNIELLQEPIGSVRQAAEQYLMSRLSLSESQMCQLNYSIGTTNHTNSQYAGKNLGFSFCPGAVTLPK